RELTDHICDARRGFMEKGMAEGEAERLAVLEMGDAAEIGARFDAAYRPPKNYGLWIPFVALFFLGVLFRFIAGGSEAVSFGMILFPAIFAVAYFVPLARLSRYAFHIYWLYLAAFTVCSAWSFFWHAEEICSRFLPYLPLFFPVVFALLIYRMRDRSIGGLLLGALFGIPGTLYYFVLFYQRTWLIFLCLVCLAELLCAMLSGWFSCKKWVGTLVVLAPVLLFASAYLALNPYFFSRINGSWGTYYSPFIKEINSNMPWFGATGISALSEGSRSLMFDTQQLDYLTGPYFLTWLASRLGRFSFAAVAALFAVFLAFALYASLRQRSMLYHLASFGITVYFLIDCVFNVLANIGVIDAITFLPFVSGNGISLVCNAVLSGLLFSILYNGALVDDEPTKKYPRWRLKLVKEEM
nr:permease prefix domain 1-containing protein [Clostridia bacterium]